MTSVGVVAFVEVIDFTRLFGDFICYCSISKHSRRAIALFALARVYLIIGSETLFSKVYQASFELLVTSGFQFVLSRLKLSAVPLLLS